MHIKTMVVNVGIQNTFEIVISSPFSWWKCTKLCADLFVYVHIYEGMYLCIFVSIVTTVNFRSFWGLCAIHLHTLTHKSKHTHFHRGSLSLMSLSLALCLNLAKSVRAPQSFQRGFQTFKTFTRPVLISKYYGTYKICPNLNTRTSPQIYTPSISFFLQHFPARMLRRSQD